MQLVTSLLVACIYIIPYLDCLAWLKFIWIQMNLVDLRWFTLICLICLWSGVKATTKVEDASLSGVPALGVAMPDDHARGVDHEIDGMKSAQQTLVNLGCFKFISFYFMFQQICNCCLMLPVHSAVYLEKCLRILCNWLRSFSEHAAGYFVFNALARKFLDRPEEQPNNTEVWSSIWWNLQHGWIVAE